MAENLTLIISINLLRFFATYYQHRADGICSLWDIIFDILLTIITTWFLIIVFFQNKSPFSEGAFTTCGVKAKHWLLIKSIMLIVIKFVLDIAVRYIACVLTEWRYIIEDILTSAYWFFAYVTLAHRDEAVWKNKRQLHKLIFVILIVVGISFCYDFHLFRQAGLFDAKFTEGAPCLTLGNTNLNFKNSVKVFALDTVVICSLIVFHGKTRRGGSKNSNQRSGNMIRTFVRCDLIIALFLLLGVVKIAVDPQGVLYPYSSSRGSEVIYEENDSLDMVVQEQMVLCGFDVVPSINNSYYYTETISLRNNKGVTERFERTGDRSDYVLTDTGRKYGNYVQFTVDNNLVYLYGQYAICYYENDEFRIVRMDSLNKCENIPVVTQLCRQLLSEGNLFVFEYAYEYLMKYDEEFIKPYQERYAQGQFYDNEVLWADKSFYRLEYVIDLAHQ